MRQLPRKGSEMALTGNRIGQNSPLTTWRMTVQLRSYDFDLQSMFTVYILIKKRRVQNLWIRSSNNEFCCPVHASGLLDCLSLLGLRDISIKWKSSVKYFWFPEKSSFIHQCQWAESFLLALYHPLRFTFPWRCCFPFCFCGCIMDSVLFNFFPLRNVW